MSHVRIKWRIRADSPISMFDISIEAVLGLNQHHKPGTASLAGNTLSNTVLSQNTERNAEAVTWRRLRRRSPAKPSHPGVINALHHLPSRMCTSSSSSSSLLSHNNNQIGPPCGTLKASGVSYNTSERQLEPATFTYPRVTVSCRTTHPYRQ